MDQIFYKFYKLKISLFPVHTFISYKPHTDTLATPLLHTGDDSKTGDVHIK